uniref:receptor protein-tyrosine kinase n=1 Tax=Acrobeloides nanus TaxID=290746 RepID=A0A914EI43_9BILA
MTIFSESITLLFSKEFTPSRSLQIVARIPEIHGQNCENTNNLLAAYPVDENISYEFAANSKGACVFTILVPYTQETHVGSNSTITPTTVAPVLQTLPALCFDNINTNENVEVVFGYNQDFPAFVFNQDGNGEWDGVVVYGNLISVIIPENGTVGVNVTTLKEPPSTSTSINGKKKGIISSSDYPNNSIFQNTTKSVGCENGVIYGLFNLTIVYADVPDDCNFYLGAYVGQTLMGAIPLSNQTVINETNIIYNVTFISIIYTTQSTPNQGFLITYEVNCGDTGGPTTPTHSVIPNSTSTIQTNTTTPKPKDHYYIWIIISLVILFLFVALLGAFLYIWFKRKHERKMTKFLGMQYIASLRLVHRDLAARNILLTNTNIAKLSDFGLCCTCDDSFTYQASIHKKLPMKWLSLEAINDRRFSEKSDVWSFGILMYEVFSRGRVPYTNMTISEMLDFLKSGQRLECPRDANDEIYEIMKLCWELEPEMRPKFEELDQVFREILEKETEVYGYLT